MKVRPEQECKKCKRYTTNGGQCAGKIEKRLMFPCLGFAVKK